MITRRMRRRRRLLDTYVRVELEDPGRSFDDQARRSQQESLRPRLEAGALDPGDAEEARERRSA